MPVPIRFVKWKSKGSITDHFKPEKLINIYTHYQYTLCVCMCVWSACVGLLIFLTLGWEVCIKLQHLGKP